MQREDWGNMDALPKENLELNKLNFCEDCGKNEAKLYQGGSYAFCSHECWQSFGRKLLGGNAKIYCPYCGFHQPVTSEKPRICEKCHGNMDSLPKEN